MDHFHDYVEDDDMYMYGRAPGFTQSTPSGGRATQPTPKTSNQQQRQQQDDDDDDDAPWDSGSDEEQEDACIQKAQKQQQQKQPASNGQPKQQQQVGNKRIAATPNGSSKKKQKKQKPTPLSPSAQSRLKLQRQQLIQRVKREHPALGDVVVDQEAGEKLVLSHCLTPEVKDTYDNLQHAFLVNWQKELARNKKKKQLAVPIITSTFEIMAISHQGMPEAYVHLEEVCRKSLASILDR